MLPVLFTVGPVTTLGLLIFSLITAGLTFLLMYLLRKKKTVARDILFYGVILLIAGVVLRIGGWAVPIRSYGVFTAMGFFMAIWFAACQGKGIGLDPQVSVDAGVISLIAGIVGARVFYVIFFDWQYFVRFPAKIFAIWEGGQVLYGGIIFAALALIWFLKKKKIPVLKYLDIAAMSVLIGIGFGRWGCFSFGCCWGKVSESFGIAFPMESPAWYDHVHRGLIPAEALHSLKVIPTQLISSFSVFLIFFLLFLFYKKKRKFDGQVMTMMFMAYSAFRFIIECFRVNPFIGPFTAAQWTAIVIFGLGIGLYFKLKPKKSPSHPEQIKDL